MFGILLSLTLLALIGSAVFSVRTVNAYCYTSVGADLTESVKSQAAFMVGQNIFTLDEEAIIENIESEVGGIKVVNIERQFPNRVSVNFVKLYDYFEIFYGGKYYVSGVDGVVMRSTGQSLGDGVIRISADLAQAPEVGKKIDCERFSVLGDIISMLERLDYRDADAAALIRIIDLTVNDNITYVKTSGGVVIKLIGNENVGTMLRHALSVYVAKVEYRTSGMIVAINSDEVFYSEKNDYEEVGL